MNLRDLVKRANELKKITDDDVFEILMIEPQNDTLDAICDCYSETLRAFNKCGAEVILKRLVWMAERIEKESEGIKKQQMMIAYNQTEREYDAWIGRANIV